MNRQVFIYNVIVILTIGVLLYFDKLWSLLLILCLFSTRPSEEENEEDEDD